MRVWDSRAEPPQAAALREHVPAATELVGGALDDGDARRRRPRLKSPGLAPQRRRASPRCSPPRAQAGVPVQGELDALRRRARGACAATADYAPKVIAVTGTNGKTTTTALTALLVERSGRRVAVAGNIGPTMLQTLADAIDAGPAEIAARAPAGGLGARAVELPARRRRSGFEADAAALLNLSEDHLDWHGSMAAYARRQGARLRHARDDRRQPRRRRRDAARAGAEDACRRRRAASPRSSRATSSPSAPALPTRAGDWGLAVENDMAWLVRAQGDEAANVGGEIVLQHLMPADALRIRGRHNAAQRARRAGAGERDRLPARADAARAARVPRRAAPRRARRQRRRRRRLRRQQGHQRRRDRRRARRPRRRARAGASWSSSSAATARARTSRRSPRRWRATRARCVTIGRDAAAIERVRRAGRRRRSSAARRSRPRSRAAFAQRRSPATRCCSARPAPASTCSATTRTAPRSSSPTVGELADRGAGRERRHEPDRCRRRRAAQDWRARR